MQKLEQSLTNKKRWLPSEEGNKDLKEDSRLPPFCGGEEGAHFDCAETPPSERDNPEENFSMECEPSENHPDVTESEDMTDHERPAKKTKVDQEQKGETAKERFDPVKHIKDIFKYLPIDLQREVTMSKYRDQIPAGFFYLALQKGRYGLPEKRFGRFLLLHHKELLKQFVLLDLTNLRERKGGIPTTQARSFFFQKYGIRNSVALKLITKNAMSAALQIHTKKEESW